jgi:hypothetical protein
MTPPRLHGCYSVNVTDQQKKTLACWGNMINRCHRPKCPSFKNYGARGITVCLPWRKFENFLADMGWKPKHLTLERRNNNKGYFKGNCYWATRDEQSRNSRLRYDNKFGAAGIYKVHRNSKFEARIMVNKETVYLGRFSCLDAAVQARRKAEIKYGFHRE